MRIMCLVAACLLCVANPAAAGLVLSVDLDPLLPGVQSSRAYSIGETVQASFILELTAPTRISAYSFSVRYDTTELTFVTRSESAPNITGWSETNPNSAGSASGLLFNFDAFGPTLVGPRGPFVVGTTSFTAIAPSGSSGELDIEVGAFNPVAGFDGFLNDANPPQLLTPNEVSYVSASVNAVPEVSSTSAILFGCAACFVRRKRRDNPVPC